jgi:hypothetical protein
MSFDTVESRMKRMKAIKFRAYAHGKMWNVIEWNFGGPLVGRQDLLQLLVLARHRVAHPNARKM